MASKDTWDEFVYLLWELDLVTREAADGNATENDIRGTEDAIEAVLSDMGMTFSQAVMALYGLSCDGLAISSRMMGRELCD